MAYGTHNWKNPKTKGPQSITFNECLIKEFQQVVTLLKNGHKWTFEKNPKTKSCQIHNIDKNDPFDKMLPIMKDCYQRSY